MVTNKISNKKYKPPPKMKQYWLLAKNGKFMDYCRQIDDYEMMINRNIVPQRQNCIKIHAF